MTVTSETARSGPYAGNGSTTIFAYTFRILDKTHPTVIETVVDWTDKTLGPKTGCTVNRVGNA